MPTTAQHSSPDSSAADRSGSGRFATTHWSLVLVAGETRNPDSQSALSALCKSYWYPIYALVRHLGNDAESARDLTQGFFAHLLEKKAFKIASPDRGRFRNFLKTSLRNYLDHEREKAQAKMRGGGVSILNIDFDTAESQDYGNRSGDSRLLQLPSRLDYLVVGSPF